MSVWLNTRPGHGRPKRISPRSWPVCWTSLPELLTSLMHVINSVGDAIDPASVRAILSNLAESEWIKRRDAVLILAATSPAALAEAPPEKRDALRAAILKQCLLRLI